MRNALILIDWYFDFCLLVGLAVACMAVAFAAATL